MLKKGFTLIEMLIVIGIISLLVAMEGYIYVSSQRSARNGKRKSDLENIRAALEQYRSTNNSYPPSASLTFNPNCNPNSALTDSNNNTYINPLPSDPRCQVYSYYYVALPSLPSACDGTTVICSDYILGTMLEMASTSCTVGGTDCLNNGIQTCNYCLGPYGTK